MKWLAGADDVRAAGYGNLIDAGRHRDADRQAGAFGVFVVEGARTIGHLLEDAWPLESLFLSDLRVRSHPELVRHAVSAGIPVYGADQDLFDRIVGYHAHRGALALARRPAPRSIGSVVADAVAGGGPVLVIEGVNDHENLGALFRNAAAFGVGAVVLDPSTADPYYRRSVRVSVGHVLRVPFTRSSGPDGWPGDLGVLREGGFTLAALTPRGEVSIDELAGRGPWALMVGAEGNGLSDAALDAADVTVRIPMAAGVDSLNVATAAAVALHRLAAL